MKKMILFFIYKSYRLNCYIRLYIILKNRDSKLIKIFVRLLYEKLYIKHSIIIGINTKIGRNINFPHMQNIVIGEGVIIGDNCTIYQDVTIGQNRGKYPIIGSNVIVYPGAKIIGDIKVSDGTVIGANAVITKNTPKNAIVGGMPVKVIKYRSESDEFY